MFSRMFSGSGATDTTRTGSTDQSTMKVHDQKEHTDVDKRDTTTTNPVKSAVGNDQNQENFEFPSNEKNDTFSSGSVTSSILTCNTENINDSENKPKKDINSNVTSSTSNLSYSSYSDDILNSCRTGDENEDNSNMSIRQNQYSQSNSNITIKDNQNSGTFVGEYAFGMGNILNGGNNSSANGDSNSRSNSVSMSHPHSLSSSPSAGDILNRTSVLSELSELERHGISLRETVHSGAHSAIPLSTKFYNASSSNNNSAKSSPPIHLSGERMTRDDHHLFYSATSLNGSYPQLFHNESKTSNGTGTTTSVVSINKETTDNSSTTGNEIGPSTKATSEASSITSNPYMESILNYGVSDSYIKSSSSSLQGRSPSPPLGDTQKISIGNGNNSNTAHLTKPSPTRSYSTPLTDIGVHGMNQQPSFHPSSSTNNIVNIMEAQHLGNVINYGANGGNSMTFQQGIHENLSQNSTGVQSYTGGNNPTLTNGSNINGGTSQRTATGNNFSQNGMNYHDFNFDGTNKPYFDFHQALLQGNGNPPSIPNQPVDMVNWTFLNNMQGNNNNGTIYPNMNVGDVPTGGRYQMNNSHHEGNNNMIPGSNIVINSNMNGLNNPSNGKTQNGQQNISPQNNASNAHTLLMLQALQNNPGINQFTVNQLHNQLNILQQQQQQQQQQQAQQRSAINMSQGGNGTNTPNPQQLNFPSNNNNNMGAFDANLTTHNGFPAGLAMNGLNNLNLNDISTLNTLFRLQNLNLGNNPVMNNNITPNGNSGGQNINTNKGGRRGHMMGNMMGNNYNSMKTQNGNYNKGLNQSNVGGNLGTATHNSNSNMNSTPSEILEEFRSNSKNKVWDIKDITGHIVEFCQDQHGSRFIQQQLETASDEDKEVIFREVLPCASTLMTDVFGNYVVQKILEHGNQDQREKMAQLLKGTAVELALQMYGCRVIQKALEVIGKQLLEELVSEFRGHVLKCVHDQNGNHVIQKCIEVLSMRARESQDDEEYLTDQVDFIVKSFKGQVERFSTHPYGCRVIQRILEHCTPAQKDIILQEIRLCSKSGLVQDQYGNYVIQHVMKHADADDRSMVINEIKGKLLLYSQHKFASNVVEKCLQFGNRQERNAIVDEVVSSVLERDTLLQVMVRDPFGNYVVQKILDIADDQQQEAICTYLRNHATQLKKYTYGKHILVRLEKISGEKIF